MSVAGFMTNELKHIPHGRVEKESKSQYKQQG